MSKSKDKDNKLDEQTAQATPAADLESQIMDSRIAKNEREHWAAREIERLRNLVDAKDAIMALLIVAAKDALGYLEQKSAYEHRPIGLGHQRKLKAALDKAEEGT